MNLPNFSKVFYLDPVANTILPPQLMLTTKSFKPLGLIKYTNWNFSLVANGMDEFTFDVYKPEDITEDMDWKKKLILTYEKKVWDSLVDLKLIFIQDYGRFEISVNYTDNTKTVKSVHAVSLECELAEAKLYDFHVNDDEAMATMEVNEYNKVNFDNQGNFIPTTLCNFGDPEHSLIHRVLADKAPHWKVGNQEEGTGYFTPFVTFAEDEDCELSKEFQRTYTCNGESIYEFLTGTVANECNVVFVFDTINRVINCYSLTDCILQHSGEKMASAIGEDTNVFVSKEKLANEISITSRKDELKNCFRVEGGDDYINAMVAVANVNGTNYIIQFSNFQYEDMTDELVKALQEYSKAVKDAQPEYENKYLELCDALDDLYEKESGMMPQVSTGDETSASELNKIEDKLTTYGTSLTYTSDSHVGLTNGIESLAQIYVTTNFDVEVVDGSTSFNGSTWTGQIKVTNNTLENGKAGKTATKTISVETVDDEIRICEQKIEKALAKGDMISAKFVVDDYHDGNYEISETNRQRIYDYFDQYCLNRLISFYDAYETCVSTLIDMGKNDESSTEYKFYKMYVDIRNIIGEVRSERQKEVDDASALVDKLNAQCASYQETYNMKTWFINNYGETIGEACYLEYCSYRREDTYSNPNYISDGLTDSECIKKAKELLEVATKEIKKACVLQRTLNIDMNNLFMLEEFAPLYDKFSMFNYIRVATDDEILKLRLIGIDINGSSLSNVDVTFSEQVESIDGSINDLQSILEQAKANNSAFPSTIRQAKQGEEAARIIGSIRKNGLIAAQTLISNADNNEVTYGGFGILCKNQGDSGDYGLKQLRVIGNGIYLTTDAWETVEMCIGEINVGGVEKYGIIADTIIAGTIVGGDGGTYWNLDTGEFVMSSSTKVDTGEKDEEGNPIYEDVNTFVVNTVEGYVNVQFDEGGKFYQLRTDIDGLSSIVKGPDGESGLVQKVDEIYSEVFYQDENGEYQSKIDQTAKEITSQVEALEQEISGMNGQISGLGEYYLYYRFSSSPVELSSGETRVMTLAPEKDSITVGVALTKSANAPTKENAFTWYELGSSDGYAAVYTYLEEDEDGVLLEHEVYRYLHIKFSDDGKLFSKNYASTDFNDWTFQGVQADIRIEDTTYLGSSLLVKVEPSTSYTFRSNNSNYYVGCSEFESDDLSTYITNGRVINGQTRKTHAKTNYMCFHIRPSNDSLETSYEEFKELFENRSILPEVRLTSETPGETVADYIGMYVSEMQTSDADSTVFSDYTWQRATSETTIRNMKSQIKQSANEIELKVSESDFTGEEIASRINMSSTDIIIEGEHIHLNGTVISNDAFKILTDGSAEATNIVIENEISTRTLNVDTINNGAYQKTLTSNATIYVGHSKTTEQVTDEDGNTATVIVIDEPSDDNECVNNANFETLQGAINSIPKFMNGKTVNIILKKNITENIGIKYLQCGILFIYLEEHTINGYIYAFSVSDLRITGGTFASDGSTGTGIIHPTNGSTFGGATETLSLNNVQSAVAQNLKIYGADVLSEDTTERIPIYTCLGGVLSANKMEIVNADIAFRASSGAHIHATNTSGIANKYAFQALLGGIITLSSTAQAGGLTSNTNEQHGGIIKTHTPTFASGSSATTDNTTAPTPSTMKTITCKSTAVKSIRHFKGVDGGTPSWRSDTDAKIGEWGSNGYHAAFFFFGDQFEEALAGTITSMTITFGRQSGGYHTSDVKHNFYAHKYETKPSTTSPSVSSQLLCSHSLKAGETETVSVSSAGITNIMDNNYKGICVQAAGTSDTYYSVMSGSMTVKITYTI